MPGEAEKLRQILRHVMPVALHDKADLGGVLSGILN